MHYVTLEPSGLTFICVYKHTSGFGLASWVVWESVWIVVGVQSPCGMCPLMAPSALHRTVFCIWKFLMMEISSFLYFFRQVVFINHRACRAEPNFFAINGELSFFAQKLEPKPSLPFWYSVRIAHLGYSRCHPQNSYHKGANIESRGKYPTFDIFEHI